MQADKRITFHQIELQVTITQNWRRRQMIGVYIGAVLINLSLLWYLFTGTESAVALAGVAVVNTCLWYVYASKQVETTLQYLVYIICELLRNPPYMVLVEQHQNKRTQQEVLDLLAIMEGLRDAIVAQTDVLHADQERLYARVQRLRELLGDGLPRRKK